MFKHIHFNIQTLPLTAVDSYWCVLAWSALLHFHLLILMLIPDLWLYNLIDTGFMRVITEFIFVGKKVISDIVRLHTELVNVQY